MVGMEQVPILQWVTKGVLGMNALLSGSSFSSEDQTSHTGL